MKIYCVFVQYFIFSQMTSSFGGAMVAKLFGALPEYTALTPHMLGMRHVSSPSILGSNVVFPPQPTAGRHSSTDVRARMDGGFPEYMAKSPSTLR
jgi:hypothetical protein